MRVAGSTAAPRLPLLLLLGALLTSPGCRPAFLERLLGSGAGRPVVLGLDEQLDEARTLLEGTLIDFGEPRYAAHLVSGWSRDERWFDRETWVWAKSERADAELLIGESDAAGDHMLEWRCLPFRFDGAPPQRLRALVNGRLLAQLELPQVASVQRVLVPGEILRPGRNRVAFEFAYAAADPDGESPRRLSVAFDYLRLLPGTSEADALPGPTAAPPPSVAAEASIRQATGTAIVFRATLPDRPRLSLALSTDPTESVPETPRFEVRIRPIGGGERILLRGRADPAGRARGHSVDLSPLAGQAVEIEFALPAEDGAPPRSVLWKTPRIEGVKEAAPRRARALPADSVRSFHDTRRPGTNVLLVSIDTLRADHLGVYGYPRPTSPNIDAFARDAVVFENAFAHAPSTLPSHAAILTSMVPAHHGAFVQLSTSLADRVTTLAEILRDNGYVTASFNGGGQIAPEFGLNQGFDVYQGVGESESLGEPARRWLEENADRRFFLFLHTYWVHAPYRPDPEHLELFEVGYRGDLPSSIEIEELLKPMNSPRGPSFTLDEADRLHIMAAYDAEIHAMDEVFGRLIDSLKDRSLYDRTLIVFTSDHGEEFGEHGRIGWHGHTLFDELLHVPLIVKFPDSHFAGSVVERQVRGIDIAPTVLDTLGLQSPADFDGVSVLDGAEDERYAVSQADRKKERPQLHSVRAERWKLVGEELFDLAADPGETTDVAASNLEVVGRLARVWEEVKPSDGNAPDSGQATQIGGDTRARLEALGYTD